jgi:glycerol uptake facilitator-like aquaporin
MNGVDITGVALAHGLAIFIAICAFAHISGAHFNPAVSMMMWRAGALNTPTLFAYSAAQIIGAISGVWLTHFMFALPIIQASSKPRQGLGVWVSELIATLILLGVIRLGIKYANEKVAMLVALTVTAGYWFTSSTFFANPAVTLARSLTNTFVGIHPADILGFISAQLLAVLLICLIKLDKSA